MLKDEGTALAVGDIWSGGAGKCGYDIRLRGLGAVARATDRHEVVKLTGEVFSASTAGDTFAEEIVNNVANELALTSQVMIEQLGLKQLFDIVLSEGILTHQPHLAKFLYSASRWCATCPGTYRLMGRYYCLAQSCLAL